MRRPLIPLVLLPLIGALSPVVSEVGPAGAAVADKVNLIGLTVDDKLVAFASDKPATLSEARAVTGLAVGESLHGIDVRPATGELYALGSTSRVYKIDLMGSAAAATAVGTAPFSPVLAGDEFGFDFNPTVDRIRIVSDLGQNLRVHPGTGVVVGTTPDTNLSYAPGDVNSVEQPQATASAYTNSFSGSTVTSLYNLDTDVNALVLQNPPNAGVLQTTGGLQIEEDVADLNGFDIDVTPPPAGTTEKATGNVGLAALTVGTAPNALTRLYSINLATGAATAEGAIGDGTVALKGLAVAQARGYWAMGADGAVFNFGDADALGSPKATNLVKPVVGAAASPSGEGYWLVASDGGIFNYGDAGFFGSTGAVKLNAPIVGMASYGDGSGYWLVASDGGIFSFARTGTTAKFFGSTGDVKLNKAVVGMAAYPDGRGYWTVASDGGIFSFPEPNTPNLFFGSTGAGTLNQPIVGMAPYPNGNGYWLVASDGGVFSFAREGEPDRFFGSTGDIALNKPIVGIVPSLSGAGYFLVGADGGVFAFGDATFAGTAATTKLDAPVVAAVAVA